ncbi:MAG: OadG family protein [Bradyrhizobium sp.]
MDKLAFGITMMVVGVGGTFLTLAILIWTIQLLKKLFPLTAEDTGKSNQS